MTVNKCQPECAQVAREIVTDWLGAFDPPPQIDFVQSEMLQAAIVSALRAAPSRFDAGSAEPLRQYLFQIYKAAGLDPESPRPLDQYITEMRERFDRLRDTAKIEQGIIDGLWVCTGCGSRESIEQIRGEHPEALACCPERKMAPVVSSAQGNTP